MTEPVYTPGPHGQAPGMSSHPSAVQGAIQTPGMTSHAQAPHASTQDCLLRLEKPYATDQELLHAVRDVLRTMLTGAISVAPGMPTPAPVGTPGHPDYDLPTHSFGGTADTTADARLGGAATPPASAEAIQARERAAAVSLEAARRAQEQEVRDQVVRAKEAADNVAREENERRAEVQRVAGREAKEREDQTQAKAQRETQAAKDAAAAAARDQARQNKP